jgi:DNA-binding MarR family transcriptional regulator
MQSSDPFVLALREGLGVIMRRSMRGFLAYAKDSSLSMPQIGTLFFLSKHSSGVSDVGEEMGVTSAAASQMIERLVQQGLIVRSEDPSDRRAKQIVLTDKGRQVLHDIVRARQGWLDALALTLTDSEKETVMSALRIVADKVNQLDLQPEPER